MDTVWWDHEEKYTKDCDWALYSCHVCLCWVSCGSVLILWLYVIGCCCQSHSVLIPPRPPAARCLRRSGELKRRKVGYLLDLLLFAHQLLIILLNVHVVMIGNDRAQEVHRVEHQAKRPEDDGKQNKSSRGMLSLFISLQVTLRQCQQSWPRLDLAPLLLALWLSPALLRNWWKLNWNLKIKKQPHFGIWQVDCLREVVWLAWNFEIHNRSGTNECRHSCWLSCKRTNSQCHSHCTCNDQIEWMGEPTRSRTHTNPHT